MDDALNSGPKLVSEFGEQASKQKQNQNQNQNQRAEVDTSAPFESVMEAVTRFGGVGFWKPRTRNPSQPSQANGEEAFAGARVEDQATQSQNDVASEERETGEILKEIEATKTRFEKLKVKLQKEEVKVNTHAPPDDQNNNGNTAKVQVDEVELSKTEILKKVEEATKEVKTCTRVLEEALSRVEAARQDSCGMHPDCNLLLTGPTMSIGQILNRKLALAREHTEKSPPTWKVSLAQMLNKSSNGEKRGGGGGGKGVPPKRMKFGFGGISFLVAKPSTKKTKKQSR